MTRGRRARQATLFATDVEESAVAVAEEPLELPLELPLALDLAPPRPAEPTAVAEPLPPAPRSRLLAGGIDLGFHLLVAGGAALGTALLGVDPRGETLPGFALLLLVVSFFYTVVPLAFWGRTPGMAAAGLACRGDDGQPLAFAEAVRRWAGSLLTLLLLGLPALLLAFGSRRSLADRLSGRPLARG
jgi:uncharacterized RDD family membrane protein YckC